MVGLVGPRRSVLLALAVATAVASGGCGGDDEDDALSKDQLIARGDALCRQSRQTMPRPPRGNDLASLGRYAGEVVRLSESMLARFRALKPPKAERENFDRFLTAAQRRLQNVTAIRDAAGRGDAQAVRAGLAKEQSQDAPAYRQVAKQIGFRVCGSGP